jgi:DNA topoisomerase VI subunit B
MKIAESTIQVQSSGIQSEAFFTVKQSNIGHIFGILRNQLYSNKPLAIIREYCTNAFDAHIDAGIPSRPIEVSFPTAFKNSLTIRDFGKGLSESGVYDIFVSYGESTKRGTNEQVGMLGLGSKSAFCYVNDFTITSYHNLSLIHI